MKQYDAKTAARVWDRVQSSPTPPADVPILLTLMTEESLNALTYQRLSRKLPPPLAATARQLAQQEQAHAVCLKGIYTMITGEKPVVSLPPVADDPPQIVLRRCYGRQMRALAQYEARQTDPQYGYVFRSLARQEQEHCHRILEMLGALTK